MGHEIEHFKLFLEVVQNISAHSIENRDLNLISGPNCPINKSVHCLKNSKITLKKTLMIYGALYKEHNNLLNCNKSIFIFSGQI